MNCRRSLFPLLLFAVVVASCTTQKPESDTEIKALRIEYIAHASFILTYQDHSILLDPYADSVWISYTFPRDIDVDAIFSTHPHYDHDGGIFRELQPWWEGKIPLYQDPGSFDVGPFNVVGIVGKHCDPYGKEFDQKNTIFRIEVGGVSLAHWGDNGPINDEIAEALTDVDILFLPIDDTYHILKADETVEVIDVVRPRMVIPMHYRIPALEPTPGRPKNLGPIEEYFEGKTNVNRLKSNYFDVDISQLSAEMQYLIFEHSPKIPVP